MWRVICIGAGPGGIPRRVVDRGPLCDDERRVRAVAAWLGATGLYERVEVRKSSAGAAANEAVPEPSPFGEL
jgi:hypothetical protein